MKMKAKEKEKKRKVKMIHRDGEKIEKVNCFIVMKSISTMFREISYVTTSHHSPRTSFDAASDCNHFVASLPIPALLRANRNFA